jgi:hypothetical protein
MLMQTLSMQQQELLPSSDSNSNWFKYLNIPVFSGIKPYTKAAEQWNKEGITPLSLEAGQMHK